MSVTPAPSSPCRHVPGAGSDRRAALRQRTREFGEIVVGFVLPGQIGEIVDGDIELALRWRQVFENEAGLGRRYDEGGLVHRILGGARQRAEHAATHRQTQQQRARQSGYLKTQLPHPNQSTNTQSVSSAL